MELLMITATSVALLLVPVLIEHTIINTTRSIRINSSVQQQCTSRIPGACYY